MENDKVNFKSVKSEFIHLKDLSSPIGFAVMITSFYFMIKSGGESILIFTVALFGYIALALSNLFFRVVKSKRKQVGTTNSKQIPNEEIVKNSIIDEIAIEGNNQNFKKQTKKKSWKLPKVKITRPIKVLFISFLILSLFTSFYLLLISTKGFYYPVIASININVVHEKVAKMNAYIDEQGYDDLQLSIYHKQGQDYCTIVPGGVHYSRESAQETIEKAKRLIPQYTDAEGAWIIEIKIKDTIGRKIGLVFKRLFG